MDDGQLELTLPNERSAVAAVQDQVEGFAQRHGLAARAMHAAQLALEEHLTNLINYGYDDAQGHTISVRLRLHDAWLCIEVEDDGHPFDPLTHPAPDLAKPMDARPVGGLGIHMIRQSMDQLEYRRSGEKNILAMRKRA